MNYKHLLLTLDYSEHVNDVLEKGKSIAALYRAQLTLLHVLDNIPMPQIPYGTEISLTESSDDTMLQNEKNKFIKLADQLGIREDCRRLVWGNPKQEIIRIAEQEQVDLIIVGSHGRQGLALLLGSTANAVLHHANCDVMAIRRQDAEII